MKKLVYLLAYTLYFSTPFESVGIIPGISVVKLVTVFFLGIAFICFPKVKIPKNSFFLFFLAYTLWTILSAVWSIARPVTLQSSLGTILPSFVVTLFLYRLIQTPKHIKNIFMAYALGASLAALYAFYMFLSGFRFGSTEDEVRVTILGQDQNELGFLLSFGIVSILYLLRFVSMRVVEKILCIMMAALLAFLVLSTGSRTGLVILLFIAGVASLMYAKKGRIIFIAPSVISIGIILFTYLPETISTRLLETSEQVREVNMTGRGEVWEMGMSAFVKERAIVLGTGFKTFREFMYKNYRWNKAPHNTYFSTLIELGLIGFIAYMGMISVLLKKVVYLCRRESIYYSLLLFPLLLAMMTLGLEGRRWLFLIAVLILKIWQFHVVDSGSPRKRWVFRGQGAHIEASI